MSLALQLKDYRLTTAEILYHMPDHPAFCRAMSGRTWTSPRVPRPAEVPGFLAARTRRRSAFGARDFGHTDQAACLSQPWRLAASSLVARHSAGVPAPRRLGLYSAMPFDVRDFPGAPPEDRAAGQRSRRLVASWLFGVACMILVMIVLGGVTRLTGSGLSIMEWDPIMGALPPLNEAEWQRLYHLYQQIPQYTLVNEGFGLAGFKQIFWLEWIHRLWGRLIGLAFLVPLIWFWATGRIERRLRPFLVLLFVLGGLQGAVGWFMVASGFSPESTSVSPARLVIHLALALVLYVALLWTGLTVLRPAPYRLRPMAGWCTGWPGCAAD